MPPNVKATSPICCPVSDRCFLSEKSRLDTFSGFPNVSIDISKLASAGFFYTKVRDVVRCPFCKVEIGSWEPGDDPLSEHKKWSEKCPFLIFNQEVENIPDIPPSTAKSRDECGLNRITSVNPENLESLGIARKITAYHPAFSSLEDRLKSFDTWPAALHPRPVALASAGFFYTGKGDCCVCYQCGGGLKDWSKSDDPWVEHKKYFSHCPITQQGSRTSAVPFTPFENTPSQTSPTPPGAASAIENPSGETPDTTAKATAEINEDTGNHTESANFNEDNTKDECVLICKICFQKEMSIAFLPCGHVVACPECASTIKKCAVCRENVTATVRVYIA